MLALTRFRLAVCRRSLPLIAPQRQTATVQKKPNVVLGESTADVHPGTMPDPRVSVFESAAGSLDSILGDTWTAPEQNSDADPKRTDSEKPQHKATQEGESENAAELSNYLPMDLRENLYEGNVVEQLRKTAMARQFRSPVWATKSAFARAGCNLKDSEDSGVTVSTDTCSLFLYNLEQTDAVSAVLERYVREKNVSQPLSATGRAHTVAVRKAIENHPNYKLYTSLFWVTEREASIMGTSVAEDQKDRGIVMAHNRDDVRALTEDTEPLVFFNAEQLAEPHMVTLETCAPVLCLSINGSRYNNTHGIALRQYCRKHNLTTSPAAVFITSRRLRTLGGQLLPEVTEAKNPGAIKPFTCVVKDEILALHHIDLTNMPTELLRVALHNRQERWDTIFGVKTTEHSDSA